MSCDLSALSKVQDAGDPEQAAELLAECTSVLSDPSLWIWAIVFTIVCGVVGALIGRYKNAVARDVALGLLLGPIGWVISLILPARKPRPKCMACGKSVDVGDRHCRHCGASLTGAISAGRR
jgi:hypothetical protein